MEKIEEVKKMLTEKQVFIKAYFPSNDALQYQNELACEICQLFEPKLDESRLLTIKEINNVFGQDMTAIGDWIIDCQSVAKAQDAKTAPIKDAEFLDWLTQHGSQQQVELFKKEWGL